MHTFVLKVTKVLQRKLFWNGKSQRNDIVATLELKHFEEVVNFDRELFNKQAVVDYSVGMRFGEE